MPNLSSFFAGIDLTIVITSIIGGLLWGYLYNRKLNLPVGLVYHKFFTGTGYLFIILISRLVTGGTIGPWERWVGFILLWGVFCLCIRIGVGRRLPKTIEVLQAEIQDLEFQKKQKEHIIHRIETSRGGDIADEKDDNV